MEVNFEDVIACCRRTGWCCTKLWPYQKSQVEQWALYLCPRIHLWNGMWVSKIKGSHNYGPQRRCGMHGRGRAWQGACMAEGACMGRGMCGRGHAWWGGACVAGGMHGRGHVWQGACMAGGMCGRGHVWQGAFMVGTCMAGGVHGWRGGVHDMGVCMTCGCA